MIVFDGFCDQWNHYSNQPLVWSLCQWTKRIQQRRSGRIGSPLLEYAQPFDLRSHRNCPRFTGYKFGVLINEISSDHGFVCLFTARRAPSRRLIYFRDPDLYRWGSLMLKGRTLTHDEFYQKMAASKELPKTSQPSVAELEEVLSGLTAKGYTHAIGLFLVIWYFWFLPKYPIFEGQFEGLTVEFPGLKNHQCSSRNDGRRLLEMGWWRPFLRWDCCQYPTPDWWYLCLYHGGWFEPLGQRVVVCQMGLPFLGTSWASSLFFILMMKGDWGLWESPDGKRKPWNAW